MITKLANSLRRYWIAQRLARNNAEIETLPTSCAQQKTDGNKDKLSCVLSCMNWWPVKTFANLFISFSMEKTKAHQKKTEHQKKTSCNTRNRLNKATLKKTWKIGLQSTRLSLLLVRISQENGERAEKNTNWFEFFRVSECVKGFFWVCGCRSFNENF